MNTITQMLFWLANSLLIPNTIILLLLFIRSLILLGTFYNDFMQRRAFANILDVLSKIDKGELKREELKAVMRTAKVLDFFERLKAKDKLTEAYVDYELNEFEIEADKELSTPRLLSKVGPVLGLIGTLISMSPALMGLSTGNIEGMAYNMQIVFATTVIGLLISMIGLVTLQYKQRWLKSYLNALEVKAAELLEEQDNEK